MNYQFLQHKVFVNWVTPLLITALIFSAVQPAFAQIFEQDANIAQFVVTNNVEVGSEAGSNGFRQIYYIFNGNKVFITNNSYTNADPVTDKEYIAWMGQVTGSWRIFLYHIPTGVTTQLSGGDNNVNPRLSQGKIVWEGWVEDTWQIFLFDGISIRQVTEGELSLNPDIEGDELLYARKNVQGEWRTLQHFLGTNQAIIIKQGPAAKRPKFRNGTVVFEIEEWLAEAEAREQIEKEVLLAKEQAAEVEEFTGGGAPPVEEPVQTEEEPPLEESAPVEEESPITEEEPPIIEEEAPVEEEPPVIEEEESAPGETTEEPVEEPAEEETPTEEVVEEPAGEEQPSEESTEEESTPPQEQPTEEPTEEEMPAPEDEEPLVTEEEPVVPEEPTEPETVTEEEVAAELEGEPVVQEELTEEEAAALEPEPEPTPAPVEEPTSEPEPVEEPQPEADQLSTEALEPVLEPEPEPTPEPTPAPEE